MPAIALWVIFWVLFHAAIVAAVFGNQAFSGPHPPPFTDRQPLLGAAPPRFVQPLPNSNSNQNPKPKPIPIPIPIPIPTDDDADDTWEYLSRTV